MKMSTNKDAKLDLSLEEALAKDIAAFGGTKAELSVRVCGSKQGLAHKQSHFRGSYFSLTEVTDIMLNTDSRHTMHAMAKHFGGVFLDLPSCELDFPQDTEALMKKMSQIHIQMGQFFDCVDDAIEDGHIDAQEKMSIDAFEQSLRTAVAAFVRVLYLLHPEEHEHEAEPEPAA